MKKHAIIIHWLIDYIYFVRGTFHGYVHLTSPKKYRNPKAKKTPIILLPGLSLRWGFIKTLGDFLAQQGYPIFIVPSLKSNVTSVKESADLVWKLIEKNNLQNVIIVGHSKGGTIGKYILIHHNTDNRLKGVIAIATPFKGTLPRLSKLIPYQSYKELSPQSELTQSLQKNTTHNHKIISIAPSWDNHIWPQNGSLLDGATNIKLTIPGHHRILFSKELRKTILSALEKLEGKPV